MMVGYEGYIEFDVAPEVRDELIIRTAEAVDRKKGNEFYFEGNRVRFLYPVDRFKEEPPAEKGRFRKMWKDVQQGKKGPDPIFDLLQWMVENGRILNADITPYDHETGVKGEKIISIDNVFYRKVSLEEEKTIHS